MIYTGLSLQNFFGGVSSFSGTSSAVLDNRGTFVDNLPLSGSTGINLSASGQTPQIRNTMLEGDDWDRMGEITVV